MRTAAGWVLVGGQSKRMGRDKALLPLGGLTLAERTASIVGQVAGPVTLVGHPERYLQLRFPAIADDRPDCGPMGGIETVLRRTNAEWNLIVACDLVEIDAAILRGLLGFEPAARAVVADGQPLCGVYHRDCLAAAEAAVSASRLRVRDFADALGALRMELPARSKLLNMNTLEAWNEYASALAAGGGSGRRSSR